MKVARGVPEFGIEIGPIRHVFQRGDFDAVICVDDLFRELFMSVPRLYWIPINELGECWGYKPFFQAKKILDYLCFTDPVTSIYLSCHGGIHRSPIIAYSWLLSLGRTEAQAAGAFAGVFNPLPTLYQNGLDAGLIPPRLPEMYETMRKLPDGSYLEILRAMGVAERVSYEGIYGERLD